MINARKERHGAVEVANPDLGGAGVEIEGAFFVGLGRGIRGGKNLDANVWRASEDNRVLVNFGPAWSEPGDIGGLDAVCGGHWTLCKDEAVREQIGQQSADGKLAASMTKSWRRAHEDVSVSIGLDAIGQLGEGRIGQDFGPTSQVEFGLRSEIRELDGDRHEVKESMKVASKQRGKRVRTLAIGCLSGIVLLWAVCQAGLRINGTHSEPVGIYWAVSKAPAKGDFVFVAPPAEPIFKLARERGYLGAGFGPAARVR
jgi:hypothetical protein